MSQFVCVRLVRANSFDLSLLQFDPDLTFAVFFLNADRTIYGRYGSRSSFSDSERDVSLKSLSLAMDAALKLHVDYPANAKSLANKSGVRPPFATIEQSRWFQSPERVAETQSCMHCHHIGNARQMNRFLAGEPLPDDELFAWPMPDAVGLHLDPRGMATVQNVASESPAGRSGLVPDDEIRQLNGQPILSIADVQWVLHRASGPASIPALIERNGQQLEVTLKLPANWRRATELGWRSTTILLRDTVLGSLKLRDSSEAEREKLGVPRDRLALLVEYVVWETTPAGRAGFKRRDVIVEFAGVSERMTESELLRRLFQHEFTTGPHNVTVLRDGQRVALKLDTRAISDR